MTRRLGPFVDEVPGVDRSGYFNQFNQGKRSVCLDPTTTDGKAVLARLLANADVVIDNMRAGALARMGFDDARLRQLGARAERVAWQYGDARFVFKGLSRQQSPVISRNELREAHAVEIADSICRWAAHGEDTRRRYGR